MSYTKGKGQTQGSAPTMSIYNLRLKIYKKDNVIANKVKQSHKSKFRLLRLPVHYTQTGRSTPRNDNDGFSGTG